MMRARDYDEAIQEAADAAGLSPGELFELVCRFSPVFQAILILCKAFEEEK